MKIYTYITYILYTFVYLYNPHESIEIKISKISKDIDIRFMKDSKFPLIYYSSSLRFVIPNIHIPFLNI